MLPALEILQKPIFTVIPDLIRNPEVSKNDGSHGSGRFENIDQ